MLVRLHILSPGPEAPYTVEDLARLANAAPELVLQYVQAGLLEPVRGSPNRPLFDENGLVTLRRIQRLRHDLGVNIPGVGVVLELLRQIDELQAELERTRQLTDSLIH